MAFDSFQFFVIHIIIIIAAAQQHCAARRAHHFPTFDDALVYITWQEVAALGQHTKKEK